MTEPTFTPEQIADWHAFEKVRKGGKYNMFEPRARRASGLDDEEYDFVKRNYSALKAAALKP